MCALELDGKKLLETTLLGDPKDKFRPKLYTPQDRFGGRVSLPGLAAGLVREYVGTRWLKGGSVPVIDLKNPEDFVLFKDGRKITPC